MNMPKKSKKYLLVAGIVITVIVFAVVCLRVSSHASFGSSQSLFTTMSTSTEWGNTWEMRFRTADGIGEHTFKAKGDGYGLIYSSDITEGSMKIDFCDNDGNGITEILPNTTDTLKNLENGKKYKVVVTADRVKKGEFSFQMKDLKN
jgi:hypothetical protein